MTDPRNIKKFPFEVSKIFQKMLKRKRYFVPLL